MSETVKAGKAAEIIGVTREYFSNYLCVLPSFPQPIRYSPRGYKYYRLDELLRWKEKNGTKMCQANTAEAQK